MAKFGYLDDPAFDGFELQAEDRVVVQKYELPEDGKILGISAYVECLDSALGSAQEVEILRGVIYEDNAGEPGALLGVSTSDAALSDSQSAKWESALFEDGLDLTAGTYWIGVHIDETLLDAFVQIGWQDGTGVRRYATDDFTDGSPDPWPTGTDTADDVELSIFAEYIPSSQVYDESAFHIGLGYDGFTAKYGFLLDGAYRKDVQRDPTPEEFGSERDDIERVPSLARWTQDDFLGGQYALNWSADTRQFSECFNFLPSQAGRSLIAVPPMTDFMTGALTDVTVEPLLFVANAQYMTRVSTEIIERYDFLSPGIDSSTPPPAGWFNAAACWDSATNRIFVLQQNDAGTDIDLVWYRPTSGGTVTAVDASVPSNPGSRDARGLMSDNAGNLYGVFGGGQLWRIKPNDDLNDATWTKIGKLPEAFQDAVVYNGYLYILCGDTDQRTVLLVFDGTNLNTLVEIPFNFIGKCLAVYGGRIYVGGTGLNIDGTDGYGELYEVNGSSLRLIRTYSPSRTSGETHGFGTCDSIETLHVHEGLLFIGASGLGRLEVYDQTTDAFYGGPEFDSTGQYNLEPLALATVRGKLACWMRDPVSTEGGVWTMVYEESQLRTGEFYPTVYPSIFDPLPATEKRWSKVVVRSKNAPVDIIFCYNPDIGNFTGLGTNQWREGDYWFAERDLSGLSPMKDIRLGFQWWVDDLDVLPELVSFTTEFAFLDSGKHAWSMTVAVPSDIESMDGSSVPQNVSATIQTLEEWQENRQPLVFTDVDGREFSTFIRDISVMRPIVGSPVDGTPEALVNVTLLEV